jgi:hypothetical protein
VLLSRVERDKTLGEIVIPNSVHHVRSKHIDVKFHWLREQVLAGVLTVTHVDMHVDKTGDDEPFHRNAMQLVTSILS